MEREKCKNVFQQIRRREYGIKQGPRSKFEILKTLLLNVSTVIFSILWKYSFLIFIQTLYPCYVAVRVTVKYTCIYIQCMYNFLWSRKIVLFIKITSKYIDITIIIESGIL